MKSRLGNTYALCAFMCAMKICDEVQAPTSFVFEHGQPNFSFVQKVLFDMLDAGNTVVVSQVYSCRWKAVVCQSSIFLFMTIDRGRAGIEHKPGFQPLGIQNVVTQGDSLGWYRTRLWR